jgi:hypothetical protein
VIIDGVRFSGVTSPAMLILSSNYSISRALGFANSTSQEILASWYRRGWVRDIMRYVIDIKVILDFAQEGFTEPELGFRVCTPVTPVKRGVSYRRYILGKNRKRQAPQFHNAEVRAI